MLLNLSTSLSNIIHCLRIFKCTLFKLLQPETKVIRPLCVNRNIYLLKFLGDFHLCFYKKMLKIRNMIPIKSIVAPAIIKFFITKLSY